MFLIFCVVYQHPVTSKLYNEKLYENLEEEINLINDKFKNYEICLLGDFNARIGELDTYNFMNEYYNTVEPRYSKLMGCVICSDYPKKKSTCANTALGFLATWQNTVTMREVTNVENITHNIITVHSRSLVVVVVSTVVQRS